MRVLMVMSLLSVAAAIALGAIPYLPGSGTDAASAKCTSGTGRTNDWLTSRWVGSSRTAAASNAEATLEEYSPWVYPMPGDPGNSEVKAWVQLVDGVNDGWAKVGWIEFPLGQRFTLLEEKNTAGLHYTTTSAASGLSSTLYEVTYNGSGSYSLYKSGSLQTTFSVGGGSPTYAQVSGETSSFADQMPGGINNHMSFTGAQVKVSGSWQAFSGTAFNSNSTVFSLSGISTTAFDIWDTACTN
jgi:hypothetical protein